MISRKETPMLRAVVGYALMILLALLTVMPFAWIIITSLHPSHGALPDPAHLLPDRLHWENYRTVLEMDATPFVRFLWNTVFVATCVVLGQLAFCSLAGYGFARVRFRGREALFFLFLVTLGSFSTTRCARGHRGHRGYTEEMQS